MRETLQISHFWILSFVLKAIINEVTITFDLQFFSRYQKSIDCSGDNLAPCGPKECPMPDSAASVSSGCTGYVRVCVDGK